MVVHGLKTIVYPVIQKVFDKICPETELIKIHEICELQKTNRKKDSNKAEKITGKKKIYLTQKQQEQLFSPKSEFIFF